MSSIPGYFPVVIDDALFARANAAVVSRDKAGGRRGSKAANVLRGIAHFASCGSRMMMLNKDPPPEGTRYLTCSRDERDAGCENDRRWRQGTIKAALVAALSNRRIVEALGEDVPDDAIVRDLEARPATLSARYDVAREPAETGGGGRLKARVLERELESCEADLAAARADGERAIASLTAEERLTTVQVLRGTLSSGRRGPAGGPFRLSQVVRESFDRILFTPLSILGQAPRWVLEAHNEALARRREDLLSSGRFASEDRLPGGLHPVGPDGKPAADYVVLLAHHASWAACQREFDEDLAARRAACPVLRPRV